MAPWCGGDLPRDATPHWVSNQAKATFRYACFDMSNRKEPEATVAVVSFTLEKGPRDKALIVREILVGFTFLDD